MNQGSRYSLALLLVGVLFLATLPSTSGVPAAPPEKVALSNGSASPSSRPSPEPSRSPPGPSGACPIASLSPLLDQVHHPSASSSSGIGGLSAHSVDPHAVPNHGFEFNVTAYKMPPASNVNDTFLLSEEEAIGDTILIMGFIALGQFDVIDPFWAVIDNATDQFTECGYSLISPEPGSVVSFQANEISGDYWEVLYRGAPFGSPTSSSSILLNAGQANWTGGIGVVTLGNWTGPDAWVPGFANLTSAMYVNTTAHGWYLPHPVLSTWNGSTGGPFWGEAGPRQLPYLAPGGLEIGADVAPVLNGTVLWNTSSPTSLDVAVTASPSDLSGGALSAITVTATATDGTPISGLGVLVTFAGGGSFSPAEPWTTNGLGLARGNFTAPIVSALLVGNLTAEVSSALYQGSGKVSVQVAPTTLLISVVPSKLSVEAGHLVNVSVRATIGGMALRGPAINLSVAASVGGGAFSPLAPWTTNAQGYANGTYQAPPTAGRVTITFTVLLTGYSGTGSATINVTAASSTTGNSGLSVEELAGAGLVVLLVVALLVALLLRRRSSSLEEVEAGKEELPATPSVSSEKAEEDVAGKITPAPSKPPARSAPSACPACGKKVTPEDGRFCPSCGSPLGKSARPKAEEP